MPIYRFRSQPVVGLAMLALAALPLAVGCTVDYAVKTTLYADGTVGRSISQPGDTLSAAAAAPKLWGDTLRYEPAGGGAARGRASERRAFADGRFASAAAIPDHLVVAAFPPAEEGEDDADTTLLSVVGPGATRPAAKEADRPASRPATGPAADPALVSRLVRSPGRVDHVFVTADVWRETLTEVVDPEGMRQARAELVYLAARFLPAAVGAIAGDEYDTSRLGDWVRGEGRALLTELTDAAAVHAAAAQHRGRFPLGEGDAPAWGTFEASAMRSFATHGLILNDDDGALVGSKAVEGQVSRFAADLLARLVTRKSTGTPADRATVAHWLAALQLLGSTESVWRDADPADAALATAAADAVRRSADAIGGPRAALARAAEAAARIVGAYGVRYPYTHQFDFSLVLPPGSLITRTDGEVVDDNAEVRWRFTGRDAWPAGYDMTCHYLVPATNVQQKLLGGQPLVTRKAIREYLDLLDRDAETAGKLAGKTPAALGRSLRAVLEACRADGSMAPLRAHRAALAAAKDSGVDPERLAFRRADCDRMFRLLKVTP